MKKELITKLDPKSPVSEVFRALRTNIQYMGKVGNGQSILMTSTMQGEGKSWIVANLAITFAQAGKNVIIVDSDMRRPRQNTIFGVDMYPGLSNYLSGITSRGVEEDISIKDCVQPTEVDNLYIIPAGNIPPNPSELLATPKVKQLIKELKNIFDIIIFDGAPCLVVTDSTVLSRSVDYTLLTAAQKLTKTDDLKEAKKRIEAVGGNVAGVVLNRVKMSAKRYENKYYYYQSDDNKKGRSKSHIEHRDIKKMVKLDEEETESDEKQLKKDTSYSDKRSENNKIDTKKSNKNNQKVDDIMKSIKGYGERKD